MIWNLNCRKVRRLLALSAGNDLEGGDLVGAQRHLAVCPSCREAWKGLEASQRVFEQMSAAPAEGAATSPNCPGASVRPAGSVWPEVARHIRIIDEQAVAASWRDWLPAGALAAACLAIVVVTLPEGQFDGNIADRRPRSIFDAQRVLDIPRHEAPNVSVPEILNPTDNPRGGAVKRPVPIFPGDNEPRSF